MIDVGFISASLVGVQAVQYSLLVIVTTLLESSLISVRFKVLILV